MRVLDDITLLRDYVEAGSEAAFAALVERHIDRVYSVALRHAGNPHLAEEITQAVFVILARKARGLRKGVILEGWLYQTARWTAVTLVRSEKRRSYREQEASMQAVSDDSEDKAWSQIVPLLDGALAGLNEQDRNAVVLRFFYGKSLREVGAVLGGTEDSARMRIQRALEKLRQYFFKRGVTSTTGMIAGAMSAHSVQAAPAALAKLATAAALAKGAAGSTATTALAKGAFKIMAWTKMQTTIVGGVIVATAAYSVMEHQAQVRLREQNEMLQKQMAQLISNNDRIAADSNKRTPHLPAPQIMIAAASTNSPDDLAMTNLYERLMQKRSFPELTVEQADAYLGANGRNATTLLAAFRTSHNVGFLREAMTKFPDDPQVAFETLMSKQLTAEEQRPWLKKFEQTAPDNALANYLAAIYDLKTGKADEAIRELADASGKHFDDYTQSRMQGNSEAYLSAGFSLVEAQSLVIPQFSPLNNLGQQLVALANSYNQAGDPSSAQAVLQMVLKMGQKLEGAQSSSQMLIGQMVGLALERMALEKMDPNATFGANGQTVQDELNRIAETKQTLSDLDNQTQPLMKNLTDQDWIIFTNRRMLFGEMSAKQWVLSKYGRQQ